MTMRMAVAKSMPLYLPRPQCHRLLTVIQSSRQYGEKKSKITDAYTTYELSLDKVVEGNMGDKNRKFNFTINFSGPANTSFTFGDKNVDYDGQGNGSEVLEPSVGT